MRGARRAPVWLPFGSVDYERHGDDGDVHGRGRPSVDAADLVLLPGFPLSHPDHRWLVEGLVGTLEAGRALRRAAVYTPSGRGLM